MAESNPIPLKLPSLFPHEYCVWKAMRSRCSNPKNSSWRYYGAKGVTVCPAWQASFAAFLDDVGAAPTAAHQIDRLENSKGYEPGNCHWSTAAEQQGNTSKLRLFTFRGVTLTITDWAAIFNLKESTIRGRIDVMGWSIDRVLLTARQVQRRRVQRQKPRSAVARAKARAGVPSES